MEGATAVARRLAELAARRQGGAPAVALSYGVASSEDGADSLDTLTRAADRALYANKPGRPPAPQVASRAAPVPSRGPTPPRD